MEDTNTSEKCNEPFKSAYDDPMFEIDDNGEIVDYAEKPDDFCLEFFHPVGNPELEIWS